MTGATRQVEVTDAIEDSKEDQNEQDAAEEESNQLETENCHHPLSFTEPVKTAVTEEGQGKEDKPQDEIVTEEEPLVPICSVNSDTKESNCEKEAETSTYQPISLSTNQPINLSTY